MAMIPLLRTLALSALLAAPGVAQAQSPEEKAPRRTRVALGVQIVPSYPGSDRFNVRPLVDVAVARGSEPFEYEAADESFGIPILDTKRFSIGPVFNLQTGRRRSEVGPGISEVGTTVELGGFANAWLTDAVRVHGELRIGVNGHGATVADIGIDYVARDGDRWLFAIGPRVSLSDGKYQDSYFRVTPRESAATGLPVFNPGSGVHSVGANATTTYQLTPRWGLYGYGKYDRLVADAGDSPIVRSRGSRNQISGGLGLSYTFGRGVR